MGGAEVGLVFALRIARERHMQWPLTLMAALSAALLGAGVLRHYWDIYIHRTVRGISFIFVGIDAAGDLFSLASIFFQPTLDILGLVIYGTELLLWIGVLACGGYFNLMPWIRKRLGGSKSLALAPHHDQASGYAAAAQDTSGAGGAATAGIITLHEMPLSSLSSSSTSVFRTASNDLGTIRAREHGT
jgi:hypothetical protein